MGAATLGGKARPMIKNQGTDTRIWLIAQAPADGPSAPAGTRAVVENAIALTEPTEIESAAKRWPGGTFEISTHPETLQQTLRDALEVPGADLLLDEGASALIVDTPGGWTLERFGVAPGSDYAAGPADDVVTRDDRPSGAERTITERPGPASDRDSSTT